MASIRVVALGTHENFRCVGGRMGRTQELFGAGEDGGWAVCGIW